jgi:HPr kinase/phosphorylase
MPLALTVQELFTQHRTGLGLSWIAGRRGAQRALPKQDAIDATASLVGHLNLIRPNWIQVLGKRECEYLAGLDSSSREDVLEQLFAARPACIIVADGLAPDPTLTRSAKRLEVPLLSSRSLSQKLVGDLQYYLSRLFARQITVHGVFIEVTSVGVLLTGESGIGKSELALELVSRGHRLVADDAAEFSLIAPDIIEGTSPVPLGDFMEVRGLGIVNVRALYGGSAIKERKYLRFIIRLEPVRDGQASDGDRLRGIHRTRDILGVEVPEVTLPVAPGHNLAVLVECTVQNYILRSKGYDAVKHFEESQRRLLVQTP